MLGFESLLGLEGLNFRRFAPPESPRHSRSEFFLIVGRSGGFESSIRYIAHSGTLKRDIALFLFRGDGIEWIYELNEG
jgi:hypothetical protein